MTSFENFPFGRLESAAIVPDLQLHLSRCEIEDYLHFRCLCMLYDIGQGFFVDPEQMMGKGIADGYYG